jgi:NAD(P)-dependent dehydrogenase (short-subunit alcohol dehydrogenase family)
MYVGMLDGRVAAVTGAGRGIGAAVARMLAAEGASVVVNDLGVAMDGASPSAGPATTVVQEIEANGGTAVANTDDIADHAGAEKMVRMAIDTYGRLDVLVNVAGILRDQMIFKHDPDDWDAVVRVHLTGTFNTTKHASAYWRELRDEHAQHRIINFTSTAGLIGSPGQPSYSAAKMGVVGLTYSCAAALRKYGVTSNAVAPYARTRMYDSIPTERVPSEHRRELDALVPEQVSPVVCYLAAEASGWCNGRVIEVQGRRVTLYSNPTPMRELFSREEWDLASLAKEMEHVFRPAVDAERRA